MQLLPQLPQLSHEIYLEIFQFLPELNYEFRLLNLRFSKCKFLYDDWDVLIAIGYTVKIIEEYIIWHKHGQIHRGSDLPAVICCNGNKLWFKNAKCHRDKDLPAIVNVDGSQMWYKNGKIHRDSRDGEDLPAIVYADGTRKWYKNDKLYRVS